MLKKSIFLGAISGILAGIASIIYAKIYNQSLGTDFSKVFNDFSLVIACLIGCILAALGNFVLTKYIPKHGELIFNLLFTILSFASIVGPFAAKLPLEVEFPELFPGMTVPMHFFPALAWFTLKPIFFKSEN